MHITGLQMVINMVVYFYTKRHNNVLTLFENLDLP